MAKPTALRVAEYRQRQREAGMVSITLNVPESEVRVFQELAASARRRRGRGRPRKDERTEPTADRMPAAHIRQAERWAVESGLRMRFDRPGLKLAEVLARTIVREVVRAGWPVGRNLGSETELMTRYGVGRNVLREAVRLLEYQSAAQMRRGAGGGLVVTEPSLDAVAEMASMYLEFRHICSADLMRTRRALQLLILDRCLDVLTDAGRQRIRSLIDAEEVLDPRTVPASQLQVFHLLLAELTGDPALELLMELILRLYVYHTRLKRSRLGAAALARVLPMHRAIGDAMVAGDRERARACLLEHLDDVDVWVQ